MEAARAALEAIAGRGLWYHYSRQLVMAMDVTSSSARGAQWPSLLASLAGSMGKRTGEASEPPLTVAARRTVLLIGTYSSKNKGDAAMEISTARVLKEAIDELRVVINSPFPELDEAAYSEYEVSRSSRRRLIYCTVLLMRALAWQHLRKLTGVDAHLLLSHEELRGFQNADAIVDLSGDMLTEDYGPHVAYSHYLPILIALALGKPVALCAQSIGPFKWTRPLARYIMNRASLVTARDPITYGYLQSMGLQQENLHLTADMAFLLDPAPPPQVEEILRRERIELDERPCLGVSLSGLVQSKYQALNVAAKQQSFALLFAQLLDSISHELDCQVLFISHVTGPSLSKDDRVVSRAVQKAMTRQSWVLSGDYRPEELKGIVARLQLFFGARMHANIAALSSAVPTVAIAYSHKTQGIMDLLGQSGRVVNIATLTREECSSQLRSAWQERRKIESQLRLQLERVRELSRRNVELLLPLLMPGAAPP
jgi:colanic acid/amylovoran biosynthesis protein